MPRTYIAIDLKSFYASVECMDRGLDPLKTNLVVADETRSDKTICLAVTPSLKAYGIPGRARLFEVKQKLAEIKRKTGKEISFIAAPPKMARYIEVSVQIHSIYLKYVSSDDIHVYSIDECFIDVTNYLSLYKMSARDLARKMIQDVLKETGITATAGIGTNLYLAKIAMDIVAKHVDADADGVRIAELDEMSFREKLWDYTPITKFWRVGRGIAERLANCRLHGGRGIFTMGELARVSVQNPEGLYKMLGVDAELLIDHAWGYEPCTIADIKKFKPRTNSIGGGQVLSHPYDVKQARIVVREMVDLVVLDLVDKGLVTNGLTLDITYDRECVDNGKWHGETITDFYGRRVPKPAHGKTTLSNHTSSNDVISKAVMELYDRLAHPLLTIKKLNLTANDVLDESEEQYDLFTDVAAREREKKRQKAELLIKQRFGKNAILKGMDFEESATTKERNSQIGGHHV